MQNFIQYLQQKNHSKTTQTAYLRYVNNFINWFDKETINCQKKDILNYLGYLKKQKKHQNITRRNSLIALNHYFNLLMQNDLIATNPTALLKIRGTKKKMLYNIYTFEELQQLHDNFYHNFIRNYNDNHIPKNVRKQSNLTRQRNYLLFGLLIYQGLATNELQKISLDDLDLVKATITIKNGRKSNQRTINLNASQIGSFINYTQIIRPQFLEYQNDQDRQCLFLPLPEAGKTKTNNSKLMGTLKQLTKQVRTLDNKFLNFKQIRASAITNWIKTVGLRKTQYFAGHRYISTTERYLSNDLESLTEDITKFNPF